MPDIDDHELEGRREFIGEVKRKLNGVKAMISGDETRRKMEADERKDFETRERDTLGAHSGIEMENTRFVHEQQRQTQVTMRQQDEMPRRRTPPLRPRMTLDCEWERRCIL